MTVKKLLVVDDQPGVRFLISEIFREEGFSVAEASNYEEAVETAKKFMPDVALVDLRLGNDRGYDGGDIIKELKQCIPELVPIIVTADGEPDKLNKAMMNGAVYCLEKPFTVGEIVGVVNEQYCRYVCK
ncbi:MAG: response regulator [Clostridiaceae bacterium]|jgi:two-component system response regulator (stage 0 sporulation protein F)|nr:response regulator [Clostridiaceae bacterium]